MKKTKKIWVTEYHRTKALEALKHGCGWPSKTCIMVQAAKEAFHRSDVTCGYSIMVVRGKQWEIDFNGQDITNTDPIDWDDIHLPKLVILTRK